MYEETLFNRICSKLFPSLPKAALENDYKLIQLDLAGAIRTTVLGVQGNASSWVDASEITGAVLGDLSSSNQVWMQKMFTLPSLNIRKIDSKTSLATTSIGENFYGNSRRTLSDINLQGMNVNTANDEALLIVNMVSTAKKRSVTFGSFEAEYCKVTTDIGRTSMSAIVGTMGYVASHEDEVVYVSGASDARASNRLTYSQVTGWWDGTGRISGFQGSMNYLFISGINDILSASRPGIKYVPVIIHADGTVMPSGTQLIPGWSASTPGYSFAAFIPVIDDGNNYVQGLFITDKGEWMHRIPDFRYSVASTRATRILFSASNYIKAFGDVGIAKPFGGVIPISALPTNLEANTAQLGENILMFLAPPINLQHYNLRDITVVEEDVEIEGMAGKLLKVTAMCDMFTGKVDKSWYNDYYQTGFGLYSPRNSNVQKNILDQWNKLDFEQLGFCVDSAFTQISPEIVYQTDLARAYAKAREKACKDNDWLTQSFMDGVTYGDIRNKIISDPKIRAFYSVNNSGFLDDLVVESPSANVTWSFVEASGGVSFSLSRSEVLEGGSVNTEMYPINTTTKNLFGVELSQGATSTVTNAQLAIIFDNDQEMVNALEQTVEALNDPYLKVRPTLTGYVMKNQYYTPGAALARSGYPVFRYMASPYDVAMAMRMYADLKSIGDKLINCITSFTGDVIIAKLIGK